MVPESQSRQEPHIRSSGLWVPGNGKEMPPPASAKPKMTRAERRQKPLKPGIPYHPVKSTNVIEERKWLRQLAKKV